MTSAQTELGSTRLVDEPNSPNEMQSTELQRASASDEIETRLGGKFSADLAALLKKQSTTKVTETSQVPVRKSNELTIRQFALIRIQSGNVERAIDFVQRHAPDQMDWLNAQLKHHQITSPAIKSKQSSTKLKVIQKTVLVDAEAGRIAKVVGQFGAWAYAHAIDDGDGRIERDALEDVWRDAEVAISKRHARRMIKEGIKHGYWTLDVRTGRIYLSGQLRLAKHLVKLAIDAGYSRIIETNKPGKRRIEVDLSGSLQESSANLYAAWMATKD